MLLYMIHIWYYVAVPWWTLHWTLIHCVYSIFDHYLILFTLHLDTLLVYSFQSSLDNIWYMVYIFGIIGRFLDGHYNASWYIAHIIFLTFNWYCLHCILIHCLYTLFDLYMIVFDIWFKFGIMWQFLDGHCTASWYIVCVIFSIFIW